MTQINLLPWREQARKIQKIRLIITFAAIVILALLICILIHLILNGLVWNQQKRNAFLETQISYEKTIYNELTKIEEQQKIVQADINFLTSLQNNGYELVKILNELARITPASVSYTKLDYKNPEIWLQGEAATNLDITLLMKNFVHSSMFTNPILTKINSDTTNLSAKQSFELKVMQKGI